MSLLLWLQTTAAAAIAARQHAQGQHHAAGPDVFMTAAEGGQQDNAPRTRGDPLDAIVDGGYTETRAARDRTHGETLQLLDDADPDAAYASTATAGVQTVSPLGFAAGDQGADFPRAHASNDDGGDRMDTAATINSAPTASPASDSASSADNASSSTDDSDDGTSDDALSDAERPQHEDASAPAAAAASKVAGKRCSEIFPDLAAEKTRAAKQLAKYSAPLGSFTRQPFDPIPACNLLWH